MASDDLYDGGGGYYGNPLNYYTPTYSNNKSDDDGWFYQEGGSDNTYQDIMNNSNNNDNTYLDIIAEPIEEEPEQTAPQYDYSGYMQYSTQPETYNNDDDYTYYSQKTEAPKPVAAPEPEQPELEVTTVEQPKMGYTWTETQPAAKPEQASVDQGFVTRMQNSAGQDEEETKFYTGNPIQQQEEESQPGPVAQPLNMPLSNMGAIQYGINQAINTADFYNALGNQNATPVPAAVPSAVPNNPLSAVGAPNLFQGGSYLPGTPQPQIRGVASRIDQTPGTGPAPIQRMTVPGLPEAEVETIPQMRYTGRRGTEQQTAPNPIARMSALPEAVVEQVPQQTQSQNRPVSQNNPFAEINYDVDPMDLITTMTPEAYLEQIRNQPPALDYGMQSLNLPPVVDSEGNPNAAMDYIFTPYYERNLDGSIKTNAAGEPLIRMPFSQPAQILSMFRNPEVQSEVLGASDYHTLEAQNPGEGYRGIDLDALDPEVRKFLANSPLTSLWSMDRDDVNVDKIDATQTEWNKALNSFIEAVPALKQLIEQGALTKAEVGKYFFRQIGKEEKEKTTKKSSGGGGGGGGGRSSSSSSARKFSTGGGGSSGSSSGAVNPPVANQKMSRIFNIMKNWSF